jgi:hypothetical protein
MSNWQIEGQYFETCNCDFLCPCISSNLAARPTEGDCKVALAFKVDHGSKDGVSLDGVSFIVVMYAPGPMGDGNITVGLIIDDAASSEQADAIAAIASGQAGGPMAALAPLVGNVAGIERRPVRIQRQGMQYSVSAGELVTQSCEGVPSPVHEGEPLYIDNTLHPSNARLALAKANAASIHAFGIDFDNNSGSKNGHFAPFSWAA